MRVAGFIWLGDIAQKLQQKHGVLPDEVREVFFGSAAKVALTITVILSVAKNLPFT